VQPGGRGPGYRLRVIVCVAANPSIDKLFEVERLTRGEIHRPVLFVQTAGGKGLNVARAARTLGAEVRAAGILRGHAGMWLEESLRAGGIDGAFVWADGENRSSLSVAQRADDGLTEFYEHGSPVSESAWLEMIETVQGSFAPGGWVTVSGSLPPGVPDDGYRHLVARARDSGMRVALDAEGERLRRALPASPDIVKVNASEAAELVGSPTADRAGSLDAATRIRELAGGTGHAGLVTRGADGVVVAGPDGRRYEGTLYERGRYPVGSGDAFLAGLVVGLERGSDWPEALRVALGAATANAETPGAGRFDAHRAEELAARALVSEL
jgi:1-phosphofructokinase family hexose kinase